MVEEMNSREEIRDLLDNMMNIREEGGEIVGTNE